MHCLAAVLYFAISHRGSAPARAIAVRSRLKGGVHIRFRALGDIDTPDSGSRTVHAPGDVGVGLPAVRSREF